MKIDARVKKNREIKKRSRAFLDNNTNFNYYQLTERVVMEIASVGSLCAGIVTMYFVKMYHTRMKKFDITGLSAVLLMLFGGAALSFIRMDQKAYWFYPIGLFVGLVLYIILAMVSGGKARICAYSADE